MLTRLEKRTVKFVLNRLTASLRGQIFLCNLEAGLLEKLIDPEKVGRALAKVQIKNVKTMHENSFLGHLKACLRDTSADLVMKNERRSSYDAFSNGATVVTVLRRSDFITYYSDSADMISGHDFSKCVPGSTTSRYKLWAATGAFYWAAPTTSFTPLTPIQSDANTARDTLGLVHYIKKVELVALHFKPPTETCYRPTVIEANPNARFIQSHRSMAHEVRWGFTVNLETLDTTDATTSDVPLVGKPELVFPQALIRDCSDVKFYHLGETVTDRDTASSDDQFLVHLLNGRKIDQVESYLIKHIAS